MVVVLVLLALAGSYEDPEHGFRIHVPTGWTEMQASEGPIVVRFGSPDGTAEVAVLALSEGEDYSALRRARPTDPPVRDFEIVPFPQQRFVLEWRARDDAHADAAKAMFRSFEPMDLQPRHVENTPPPAELPGAPTWAAPESDEGATRVELFYGTTRERLAVRTGAQAAWLGGYAMFLGAVLFAARRRFWPNPWSWLAFAGAAFALFAFSTADGFPVLVAGSVLLLAMAPPTLRCLLRRRWRWMARASTIVFGVAALGATLIAFNDALQEHDQHARVNLVYGTRRAAYDSAFGCEVGICTVSIPENRREGEIPLPAVGLPDPAEHFLVAGVEVVDDATFRARLSARASASPRRDAMLFVHGYNNTFNSAAFRAAQIAHDVGFEGAPVLFSWPSKGDFLRYSHDEAEVIAASESLARFLMGLHDIDGVERFYVVGHSMGCRVLGLALRALSSRNWQEKFEVIVLAAPDIDEEAFRTVVAPELRKRTDCPTVYVSRNDGALKASYGFHGYRRAGDAAPTPIVVDGIDTIDVSAISADHTYIGTNYRVMSDLDALLRDGARAMARMEAASSLRRHEALGHFWIEGPR